MLVSGVGRMDVLHEDLKRGSLRCHHIAILDELRGIWHILLAPRRIVLLHQQLCLHEQEKMKLCGAGSRVAKREVLLCQGVYRCLQHGLPAAGVTAALADEALWNHVYRSV